jgi:hypothetical protein
MSLTVKITRIHNEPSPTASTPVPVPRGESITVDVLVDPNGVFPKVDLVVGLNLKLPNSMPATGSPFYSAPFPAPGVPETITMLIDIPDATVWTSGECTLTAHLYYDTALTVSIDSNGPYKLSIEP